MGATSLSSGRFLAPLAFLIGLASPSNSNDAGTETLQSAREILDGLSFPERTDPPEVMHRYQNQALRVGRLAYRSAEQSDTAASLASRASWIGLGMRAYYRVLQVETMLLTRDMSAQRQCQSGQYLKFWNEACDGFMNAMGMHPEICNYTTDGGNACLGAQALVFSSKRGLAGDCCEVPVGAIHPRMASFAESVAGGCVDSASALMLWGVERPELGVIAMVAEWPELDALVGFSYGTRYWHMPEDVDSPRPEWDPRVLGATLAYINSTLIGSMLMANVAGMSDGVLPEHFALRLLREGNISCRVQDDVFSSTPGLREPRIRGGRLVCDIALWDACRPLIAQEEIESLTTENGLSDVAVLWQKKP